MMINGKKTKLMLFSESTTADIHPEILVNGTETEVVDETKLLGVVLTSDLKWKKNKDYIVTRCFNFNFKIYFRTKNYTNTNNTKITRTYQPLTIYGVIGSRMRPKNEKIFYLGSSPMSSLSNFSFPNLLFSSLCLP